MKTSLLYKALSVGLVALLGFGLAGCGAQAGKNTGNLGGRSDSRGSSSSQSALEDLDLEFSDRDLDPTYDDSSAIKISLTGSSAEIEGGGAVADGSTVLINGEGTYLLTGTLDDGSIVVEASDEAKVQLVLGGVQISNSAGSALMVENADKCFITLAEGTSNVLSDGKTYTLNGDDDNRDGTVFSRDDLTINGTGTLEVYGNYQHGVVCKDEFVIGNGNIAITSVEDAFQGKDCIKIADGEIVVNAGDDAFHSDGYFYAKDGRIDVQSCYEGYEAEQIIIDGGDHSIVASDDGINASVSESSGDTTNGTTNGTPGRGTPAQGGKGQHEFAPDNHGFEAGARAGGQMSETSDQCIIQINGGTVNVTGANDGLDSNGNVEINGGMVLVCGPSNGMDGCFDYDLSAQINGGCVLMLGAVGNVNGLDESEQPWSVIQVYGLEGQSVELCTDSGTQLASLTASMNFSSALVSSPEIAEEESFKLIIDKEEVLQFQQSNKIAS